MIHRARDDDPDNAGDSALSGLRAVEFIRQRTQRFRQQAQFGAVDRQLAGFGFEQLTFRAEDIAKIPPLELLLQTPSGRSSRATYS